MLIDLLKDRVWCTTKTESTGTYTSEGPVPGHRDIDAVGHAKRSAWCCTDGVNTEIFYGTVSVGGSKTLTRDQIIYSTNGNNPVAWTPGTRNLFLVAAAQDIMLRNITNVMESPLDMDGKAIILTADGASQIVGTSSGLITLSSGTTAELVLSTGTSGLRFRNVDAGAGIGLGLNLLRDSSSPAAADFGEPLRFQGKTSTDAISSFARLVPQFDDVVNGSEDCTLFIQVMRAGALINALALSGSALDIESGNHLRGGGKTGVAVDTAGWSILNSAQLAIRAASATPVFFGRDDSGTVVSIRRNSVEEGSISNNLGTVSYNTFTGSHYANLARGHEGDEAELFNGALLCAVDQDYAAPDGTREKLPCVRLSRSRRSKAVYGIFGGWLSGCVDLMPADYQRLLNGRPELAALMTGEELLEGGLVRHWFRRMIVNALGISPEGIMVAGTAEIGDTLMSSNLPGVAEVAPEGTDSRYLIGKSLSDKPSPELGRVRAVLYAG